MRLHLNLVLAVLDGLDLIFNNQKYADKVVPKLLKRDQRWGARDRHFIADTIYDMVRWKRLYTEIAEVKSPLSRPNLWRMFGVWATLRGIPLPDWKQLANTPNRRIKGKFDQLSKIRKYREAIPDWLDTLCQKELSQQWDKEIRALNQQADVVLRVNRLKTTKAALQDDLLKNQLETQEITGYPSALKLNKRAFLNHLTAFTSGLFELQDPSSQLVAPFLQVQPGQKVIDACAGAGGKSLHLADLMQNKGQIIALDTDPKKLKTLQHRARRAGVFCIETRCIEGSKTIKKLHNKADRVLIDTPCSGIGVLKRNPDTKWKLQPEALDAVRTLQLQLLCSYSKMLKPSGKLVYATCSILPSENQLQVQAFLATESGTEFDLIHEQTQYPSSCGFDGFYMALLQRK